MSFQTPKPKALNLTPATSVTSSLSSRSEPPSPVAFNLLSIYDVSVNPPESLPDQENPIFFTVTIRNNMTGAVWVIKRRYSAFDALKNELWWRRVATAVKIGLPPKVPPPGHNLKALRSRANGLEAWATQVLQQPDALRLASVIAFFGRTRAATHAHSILLHTHCCSPFLFVLLSLSAHAVDAPCDASELAEAETAIDHLQARSRMASVSNSPNNFHLAMAGSASSPTGRSNRSLANYLLAAVILPLAFLAGLQKYPEAAPAIAAAVNPYTAPSYTYLADLAPTLPAIDYNALLTSPYTSFKNYVNPPPPPPPPPKTPIHAIVRKIKAFLKNNKHAQTIGKKLKSINMRPSNVAVEVPIGA